ncbi:transcriptional regulator [Actinoplanes sp. ATCC 53533]|nr:transcriptional regulator [Actinoplanes sp. ATCC 53533]
MSGPRRGPGEASNLGPRVTPGQVAEARKDLGRQLAERRDMARITQRELARRLSYSRSTVANVEIGRHCAPRKFWQRADREVGATGGLLAAFEQVDALVQALQTQATQARERQRAAKYAPAAPPVSANGCGCGLVVGRWTGRETRALREALRMSLRIFAEHLGVRTSTVSGWEHQRRPAPPSLATQAMLDQALKSADPDTKTRFGLILASTADCTCSVGTDNASGVAYGSTVTPLHGRERTRAAS